MDSTLPSLYNNSLVQAIKDITGLSQYADVANVLDTLLATPTDQLVSAIAGEIMMISHPDSTVQEKASPLLRWFRFELTHARPLTFAYLAQDQRFAIGEGLYAHQNARVRTYGSKLMYIHAPGTPARPLAMTDGDHVFKINSYERTWADMTLSEAFLRKFREMRPGEAATPMYTHTHLRMMARLEREITIDADLAAQTGEGRIVGTWWRKP